MHLHATVSKDGHKLRTCLHPSRRIAVATGDRNAPQDDVGVCEDRMFERSEHYPPAPIPA